MTKLERFMRAKRIGPMALVRASGVSRRHLFYLRHGKSTPSLGYADAIAKACSKITGELVTIDDVFAVQAHNRRKAS